MAITKVAALGTSDVARAVGHVRVHGRGGRVAKVEDATLLLLLAAPAAPQPAALRGRSEKRAEDAAKTVRVILTRDV